MGPEKFVFQVLSKQKISVSTKKWLEPMATATCAINYWHVDWHSRLVGLSRKISTAQHPSAPFAIIKNPEKLSSVYTADSGQMPNLGELYTTICARCLKSTFKIDHNL